MDDSLLVENNLHVAERKNWESCGKSNILSTLKKERAKKSEKVVEIVFVREFANDEDF